ncbi:MAG: bifunctional (p)ppGpp synthetase/guanosine-3',5'-bis(diphosphate) 3'-pyrophosphohydrolase [Bacteroidales bacterium]|nr:bifunctional (p)ppGpp synthetase/guanosine-3',5'-bis(diphosphate) 3'-pyrophosphohydrolase [Bacteroidales bacterium]
MDSIVRNQFLKYKNYLEQIQGEEYARLFEKAWDLLAIEQEVDAKKKAYVLGVIDILANELNTFSSSLISAVFACGLEQLPEKKFIVEHFSEPIWRIVEGSSKIKRLNTDKAVSQPDYHRQLLLSVSNDMRAVLIQLAAHVYQLRHINEIENVYEQNQLLDLVESVYIPISHRLGFYKLKSEMEDIVLEHREPEYYYSIKQKLIKSEKERKEIINAFVQPIKNELDNHKLDYQIKSRVKSINSIYVKMKKQGVSFENVFDLWAIRIILKSDIKMEKADCWHAYSVVTNIYKPDLSRLRDWITVPKSSGYESLHATVQGQDKRFVEVQIRTSRMDDEAENGMAAHWKYKGGKDNEGIDHWLSQIRKAIQNEGVTSGVFDLKNDNSYSNEIFVFTPQGDLKKLPGGASVLDFAYHIHTDIGSHCANAMVNGKIVPIKHVLKNGDQVQIITAKNQKPSIDWLKIVVSNRTKVKIRKALDEERLLEIKRGKEIVERRFKNWKMDLNQQVIDKLVEHYKFKQIHDLYLNVSLEKIDPLNLKKVLLHETDLQDKSDLLFAEDDVLAEDKMDEQIDKSSQDILTVDQIDHINYKFAKCCNPIPGDRIFGFVTVTKGITIHRNTCKNAANLKERFHYRIIPAQWKSQKHKLNFKTTVIIQGNDEVGLLNKVTQVISNDLRINIMSSNFKSEGGNFIGQIKVFVHNVEHLDLLLEKLKTITGVEHVYRKD